MYTYFIYIRTHAHDMIYIGYSNEMQSYCFFSVPGFRNLKSGRDFGILGCRDILDPGIFGLIPEV